MSEGLVEILCYVKTYGHDKGSTVMVNGCFYRVPVDKVSGHAKSDRFEYDSAWLEVLEILETPEGRLVVLPTSNKDVVWIGATE